MDTTATSYSIYDVTTSTATDVSYSYYGHVEAHTHAIFEIVWRIWDFLQMYIGTRCLGWWRRRHKGSRGGVRVAFPAVSWGAMIRAFAGR